MGGVFFTEVGLGHETCLGQWKVDRSNRVALPRGLPGHHVSACLLGASSFYHEKNMLHGAKARELAWAPEVDTWRRPALDRKAGAALSLPICRSVGKKKMFIDVC